MKEADRSLRTTKTQRVKKELRKTIDGLKRKNSIFLIVL
jgi:hypothetical protein